MADPDMRSAILVSIYYAMGIPSSISQRRPEALILTHRMYAFESIIVPPSPEDASGTRVQRWLTFVLQKLLERT